MILVSTIPMIIGLIAFALRSGTGFNLHGSRTKPIYLPHRFGEVVTFIRRIQDKQTGAPAQAKKKLRKTEPKLEKRQPNVPPHK